MNKASQMRFKVTIGHDARQRPINRYFDTLEDAKAFASTYFRRKGVVLGIEIAPARKKDGTLP